MPRHSGHAPKGLLNENIRGVSSSMENPHFGQARELENVVRVPVGPRTVTRPAESLRASSTDSVSRVTSSGETTRVSTITSTVCFFAFSSLISDAADRISTPSTTKRRYPCLRSWSMTSRCSPFWARITGAMRSIFSPLAFACTAWTIRSTDWGAISSPSFGQWGIPIRANSNRR